MTLVILAHFLHLARLKSIVKGRSSCMYQPNFCSDCGTRIMRERWHLWTSRRFCDSCAPRLRHTQITLPAFFSVLALILGWSLGQLRQARPPLIIEQRSVATTQPAPPNNTAATPQTLAALAPSTVSLCGARTKKGAPCSRRINGTGRCYQHLGLPAMLPPEQLIVRK